MQGHGYMQTETFTKKPSIMQLSYGPKVKESSRMSEKS